MSNSIERIRSAIKQKYIAEEFAPTISTEDRQTAQLLVDQMVDQATESITIAPMGKRVIPEGVLRSLQLDHFLVVKPDPSNSGGWIVTLPTKLSIVPTKWTRMNTDSAN